MPSERTAARGWRLLGRGREPSEIRVLRKPSQRVEKSAVYWLGEAGPGGAAVIAKCAPRATAAAEALVYGEFLGRLGVPAPAYHGMLDEGGPFCWLFVEYVPGSRYSPADPRHRRLAGRWLGRLHGGAAALADAERLPERGMQHHLRTLDAGRAALAAHGDDRSLSPTEASTLRRLAVLLGEVRGGWSRLEAICAELPPTLVHGDLVRKNLRIGVAGHRPEAIAFDWENAGWGPPAVDLARSAPSERLSANACLDAYRSARGPDSMADREGIERQATAGTLLRLLTAIDWASLAMVAGGRGDGDAARGVAANSPKTLARLEAYLAGLENSWRTLGARGWI